MTTGSSTSAISGGGIQNFGEARIYGSRIHDNRASDPSAAGGGISCDESFRDYCSLVIEGTSIDGNRADSSGTNRAAEGGGLLIDCPTEISHSTISENWAEGERAFGVGVYVFGGPVDLINSTISGNWVTATGDLDPGSGGGIAFHDRGSAEVVHTTFYGNEAEVGAALWEQGTYGRVTVTSSIFGGSVGPLCDGPFVDGGGGNLAENDTCRLAFGELEGLDSSLADHGGPTMSHSLADDSTALGIVYPCGLGTDQRGARRPLRCDSGAFENLGCPLLEIKEEIIDSPRLASACDTALLGPDLLVESTLDLTAGYLVSLANDTSFEEGATVQIRIVPPE